MSDEELRAKLDEVFNRPEDEEYRNWVWQGVEKGWVSPPFCMTHDGDNFLTKEEEEMWEEGGDPCTPVLKLIYETGFGKED